MFFNNKVILIKKFKMFTILNIPINLTFMPRVLMLYYTTYFL